MALDESSHRLFIGCRKPSRLVIFDTERGVPAADLEISGDTDDLFFDAKRQRPEVLARQMPRRLGRLAGLFCCGGRVRVPNSGIYFSLGFERNPTFLARNPRFLQVWNRGVF